MRLNYLIENKLNIPKDVIEKYMGGNCLLFAEALQKLLGNYASIYSVLVGFGGNDITVAHVVVEYKGYYWDIKGKRSEKELVDEMQEMGAPTVFLAPYNERHWEHWEESDDHSEGSSEERGRHFPEPVEETMKWANVIAQMAK